MPIKRQGVENWTPEDFAEDARRAKAYQEAYEARKKALTDRGWVFHRDYCHRHGGDSLLAVDPLSGSQVSSAWAYTLQEEREPGSVPPWPKFENTWEPPPSTEGLFSIGEVTAQPLAVPSAAIFYMTFELPDITKEP